MSDSQLLDVLIIGGGPAGLSTATALNRLMHTCIVFDHGVYRNERSKHMHNVPTWDHKDPADFRAATRRELTERYNTTRFVDAKVENLTKLDDGSFQATDSSGNRYLGKKVVLATGVQDLYPEIAGYDDCWGHGIYHCLYCHGYEERGTSQAAVLAVEDMGDVMHSITVGCMAKRLAHSVTILTHGNTSLTEELKDPAAAKNLKVDSRRIARFTKVQDHPSDVIVEFEDGSTETFSFIAHKPRSRLNGPWAEQLRVELTPGLDLKTNPPFNETSVSGVFAAGDCASPFKVVAGGISMGVFVASGAAMQVQQGL